MFYYLISIFWWFPENSTLQNSPQPWTQWRSGFYLNYRHYYVVFCCCSSATCFRNILLFRVLWSLKFSVLPQTCFPRMKEGHPLRLSEHSSTLYVKVSRQMLDRHKAGLHESWRAKVPLYRDTGALTWTGRRGRLLFKKYSSYFTIKGCILLFFF